MSYNLKDAKYLLHYYRTKVFGRPIKKNSKTVIKGMEIIQSSYEEDKFEVYCTNKKLDPRFHMYHSIDEVADQLGLKLPEQVLKEREINTDII